MKKSKRTMTPKLRFPEFRDKGEWKSVKLSKVFEEYREKSTVQDQYEVLTSARRGLIRQKDYYGEGRITDRDNVGFNIIPPNYITYRSRADDRRFYFNENNLGITGIISTYYPVFRLADGSNKFFIELLAHHQETVGRYSVGTSQTVLSLPMLGRIKFPLPTPAEQQKIAECLNSLDGLITAEGRKLEALRDHKRGLMQQLFPQPGQTQPRLRFPEFRDRGEWGEEKLSRHIKLISGVHLSPSDYSDHGQIPYFTGPSDFTNEESHVSKWTSQTDNKGVAHDILITVKGSGVGELWYLDLPQVALGRQLMAVRPLNGINRFYFQLLLSKRRLFEDLAMGNLIPGLSRGDILNLQTPLPREAEQQKIADCLSALDTKIAAQAAKIDSLEQHKRGLMQQLFPAPEEQI